MARRAFLKLATLLSLGLALISTNVAVASEAPKQMVERLGGNAIEILAAKDVTAADRRQKFARLFTDGFDVPLVARIVLGRYWRTATPAEQDEFVRLFNDYVIDTYASRLNSYTGQTLNVTGSSPISDTETMVNSKIEQPQGDSVKVDWRVLNRGGDLRIVDVVVEGVSMAISQRSEFGAVIAQNGGQVEALLARLRTQTAR
ncbi:MAG: ABC transporter substrate-binding protein [Minwuia sp.]|nr:ABC transporter substrate-binding protein [Minwuia sp.]